MPRPQITEHRNGSRTLTRTVNMTTDKKPWILLLSDKLKKGDTVELTMNKDGVSGSFKIV